MTFSDIDALQFIVVLVVTVLASVLTGYFAEPRWRKRAKDDLEIYALLKDAARTDDDKLALEILKRSAVKEVLTASVKKASMFEKAMMVIIPIVFVLVYGLFIYSMVVAIPGLLERNGFPQAWPMLVVFVLEVAFMALSGVYMARMIVKFWSDNRGSGITDGLGD